LTLTSDRENLNWWQRTGNNTKREKSAYWYYLFLQRLYTEQRCLLQQ